MKSKHKYFRNARYKNKCLMKIKEPSKFVTFWLATKEEPMNSSNTGRFGFPDWQYDKVRRVWRSPNPKVLPGCSYTIIKESARNYDKRLMKKKVNRQVRHNKTYNSSQRRNYRKLYEFWWNIY